MPDMEDVVFSSPCCRAKEGKRYGLATRTASWRGFVIWGKGSSGNDRYKRQIMFFYVSPSEEVDSQARRLSL